MPEEERLQSRTADAWAVVVLFTALALNGILALFGPPETNPKHEAILETALATFFGWCLGVSIAVSVRNPAPGSGQYDAEQSRILYTWGCAMCFLHIAVAFHLAHGWSHEAAVRHVEQLSGFGDGIYVNYVFAGVWLADVIWAWVSLDGYLNRPRWVSWAVHGFMAFIMFNAAVVFGSGIWQRVCALFFVAGVYYLWRARRAYPAAVR